MTLDEIILTPEREDNMNKYVHHFVKALKQPAFHTLKFAQSKTADEHYLGLFQDDSLVSYLQLEIRTNDLWQIVYTQTTVSFRGQGCFRYLLEKSVVDHGQVLSDSHQTVASANAWKSLIRYPGGRMLIFVYNTDTKQLSSAHEIESLDIWNQTNNPILLATKVAHSMQEQENMDLRDRSHLAKKTGRDHNSIWFGPGTSNGDYINP